MTLLDAADGCWGVPCAFANLPPIPANKRESAIASMVRIPRTGAGCTCSPPRRGQYLDCGRIFTCINFDFGLTYLPCLGEKCQSSVSSKDGYSCGSSPRRTQ